MTYLEQQIARSRAKWGMNFCKVSIDDTVRYREMLGHIGNICCMGVRRGKEVNNFKRIFGSRVVGMECNPDCDHPDVVIGSFDEPPIEWVGTMGLVFSNSLDHSQDPHKTVRIWSSLLKPGGFMILALNGHEAPNGADCANFTLDDLKEWLAPEVKLIWTETDTPLAGHYPEAWFQHE